jgi:hypothetical protein
MAPAHLRMVAMPFQARGVADLADDRTMAGGRSASNRGIAAWKSSKSMINKMHHLARTIGT